MNNFKKRVSAITAAALVCTAMPVNGPLVVQAADNETQTVDYDSVVKLVPSEASKFNDTNGDGLGEFQGWGTSLCWWANRLGYSETMTEQAARYFFSEQGLNMNIGRYNVGGGDDVSTEVTNKAGGDSSDEVTLVNAKDYAATSADINANKIAVDTSASEDVNLFVATIENVELKKGENVIQIGGAGGGWGLDFIKMAIVGDKVDIYDLTTNGKKPTYSGSNMEIQTVDLSKTKYSSSDDDFGIKAGETGGQFKYIGWINELGGSVGSGDNLRYTVNAAEEGTYTVKMLLTLNGTNDRGMAIRVGQVGNQTSGSESDANSDDPFLHAAHIKRSDSVVPGYCTDVTKMDLKEHDLAYYQNNFARADEESGYAWNYDWDADKNQMNILIAAAKASGDDFISEAFSNSPPYFMTVSGCSSGHVNANSDNLRTECYTAFACYMADVIEHINNEDNGIVFQSATGMNEPYTNYWAANSNKQEGCHFDIGQSQSDIIVALNKELKNKGIDIIISASDETSIDTAIKSYNELSDEAKEVVTRIDTHTYSGSKRAELKALAEESNENLWMSEVDGAFKAGTNAGEMTCGLGLAERIMTDINDMDCTAWILWNAVDMNVDANNEFDKNSIEELKTVKNSNGEIDYNPNSGYWGIAIGEHNTKEVVLTKKYYAYGQFTRYIRPGMTIIGSVGGNTLAAYDSDNHQAVIVALNTAAEDTTTKFSLANFASCGSSVKAVRTSGSLEEGENWADVSASDDIVVDSKNKFFTATLAANSVTTYIIDGVTYDKNADVSLVMEEINLSSDMVSGSKAWNNSANTAAKTVDDNLSSFFDGLSNGYVIIDLGTVEDVAAIGYAPRNNYESRMKGGMFYGSNDGENWTLLYTVPSSPASGTITYAYADMFAANEHNFRYIKYTAASGECCNIAEIKLYAADKSLASWISFYNSRVEGNSYSESTMAAFNDAVAKAQDLVDSKSTDVTAINNAKAELKAAYEALKKIYTYSSITGSEGERLYDTEGNLIQAHGGQIQQLTVDGVRKYYWIGEDKTAGYRPCPGIHMYTSTDLYNWKDEGLVLKTMKSESDFNSEYFSALYGSLEDGKMSEEQTAIYDDLWQGNDSEEGCVIERPKMLYNEKTGKYVIWFHADGTTPNGDASSNYAKAKAGIAIADSPTGPYKLLGTTLLVQNDDYNHNWDKIGGHLRDMNLFLDDDGSAYVMYSSDGNQNMYIARLNDDFTGLAMSGKDSDGNAVPVEGTDYTVNFVGASREAPAMFKADDKYYMITSGCTGWAANAASYAMADSVLGPWTTIGNPCTDEGAATTYDTQSTCVVKLSDGQYMYMGDRWFNPDTGNDLSDSRYVWLPIEFDADGHISIASRQNWKLDVFDSLKAFKVTTELPSKAASVASLKKALPEIVEIQYVKENTSKQMSVSWTVNADDNALAEVTAVGTLANGRTITKNVTIINHQTIYFFDCAAGTEGVTTGSYFTELKNKLGKDLLNTAADQSYTVERGAGYSSSLGGDKDDVDMSVKNGGDSIWSHGYWAHSKDSLSYSFDLKPGKYAVTEGFYEWWSTERYLKITVDGLYETLASKTFTLGSGDDANQQSIEFEVDEEQTITVSVVQTKGADAVLSWVAVLDLSKEAEVTPVVTPTPTAEPTPVVTPTAAPTAEPTAAPTAAPTTAPVVTAEPTAVVTPTAAPTAAPTTAPTTTPVVTAEPTPAVVQAPESILKDNKISLKSKGTAITYKAKKTTKKLAATKTVKLDKYVSLQGKAQVSFKKLSGNKNITLSKSGKLTVKKGLKKGTYKVKIKITSSATDEYKAADLVKTIKITVK